MNHRSEPDPSAAELANAKRQLERAGLGDLASDPLELAEVLDLVKPHDQDHAPAGRWVTRASGPDIFIPYDDTTKRLAEAVADGPASLAYDPSVPGAREEAIAMMRKYIDMGRRCPACASLECPAAYSHYVDDCAEWQAAEARRAAGVYLTTEPGPVYTLHAVPVEPCPGAITSDMPACPPEPWLRAPEPSVESSPDAYTYRPPRAVPRPYGGRHSDPWGRAWCDCGEPLELHAHIPGSVTGAWCYAPRDVRRPGELLGRVVRAVAWVCVGAALGLLVLYAIAVGMVLYALSG